MMSMKEGTYYTVNGKCKNYQSSTFRVTAGETEEERSSVKLQNPVLRDRSYYQFFLTEQEDPKPLRNSASHARDPHHDMT